MRCQNNFDKQETSSHFEFQLLCGPDGLHPERISRGHYAVTLGRIQIAHLSQVDSVIGVDGEVLAEEDVEGRVGESRLSDLTKVAARDN